MDVSWVLMVGSVSVNSQQWPEIAMVTHLVLNTLQSAVQENLSETVSVKIQAALKVQHLMF